MMQYAQEKILARGSLGSVILAKDRCTGEARIVKQTDLRRLERSTHEALLAEVSELLRLQHPNICRPLHVFFEDMTQNLVLEFVDGKDLAKEISSRKAAGHAFDPTEALHIAGQLASALAHAHGRRVLHRDLRCENVIMTPSGDLKLLDFCVATIFHFFARHPDGLQVPQHGHGQHVLPLHFSPEVCCGHVATAASDLWSLGVVLYTTLALKPPFHSFNLDMLLQKIQASNPPGITGCPEAPTDIWGSLLQKDPIARPTANDLLRTLAVANNLGCVNAADAETPPKPLAPPPGPRAEVSVKAPKTTAPGDDFPLQPLAFGFAAAATGNAFQRLMSTFGDEADVVRNGDAVDRLLEQDVKPERLTLQDLPPLKGMRRDPSAPAVMVKEGERRRKRDKEERRRHTRSHHVKTQFIDDDEDLSGAVEALDTLMGTLTGTAQASEQPRMRMPNSTISPMMGANFAPVKPVRARRLVGTSGSSGALSAAAALPGISQARGMRRQ